VKHFDTLSIPFALMLVLASASIAPAETPARPSMPKSGSVPVRRDPFAILIQQVEGIYGKPLTEPQKKAVIAAAKERARAQKAARDKFRADVARVLGLSLPQLAEKEKAYFKAHPPRRVGRP
jgi:hypothetical protein